MYTLYTMYSIQSGYETTMYSMTDLCIQSLIDTANQPTKHSLVKSL